MTKAILDTYRQNVLPELTIRRVSISAENIQLRDFRTTKQYDLFTDIETEEEREANELSMQKAVINIKKRYGKNAILKGINFEKESTGRQRNQQIGGHRG